MASIYKPNKDTDIWWLKYHFDKEPYRTSLQTYNKKEAEILKSQVELALKEGKTPSDIKYLIKTIEHHSEPKSEPHHNLNKLSDDSIDRLLKSYLETSKTYKAHLTVAYEQKRLEDFFGWMHVDNLRDISSQHILDYINHKSKKLSAVTVNRYIDNIKTFFKFVSEFNTQYLGQNPATKIKKIKVAKHIPRYLSLEEIKAIREVCPETFRPVFETYLHTGMRKSELIYLEWQDIDFKKKEIIIRPKKDFTPKDKEPRIIPIDESLCKTLKALQNGNKSGYVFGHANGKAYKHNLNRVLTDVVRKAGIKEKVDFNILRHTFASYVTQEAGIAAAAELLGHSNIRLTHDYYAHLTNEYKSKIVNKLPY